MNKIPCASQNTETKTLPAEICIFSLWMVFIHCCRLSWLPIWLWSVMMDPCFIHCHIPHVKIFFVRRTPKVNLVGDVLLAESWLYSEQKISLVSRAERILTRKRVAFALKYVFLHLIWNILFYCAETTPNCVLNRRRAVVFWSTVRKRGTHFEEIFLMLKCSCKVVNTLPSNIFMVSVISCNFNLRSAKTILWTFLCFLQQLPNLGDQSVQHHRYLYGRV